MTETKVNYDEDGDILYISFDQSRHVTGIELADNVLLRLDTGKATGAPPRAIGLTFLSFAAMMDHLKGQPLHVSLTDLRGLPDELWLAVLTIVTSPPVSDYLSVGLSLSPQIPPLPEKIAA